MTIKLEVYFVDTFVAPDSAGSGNPAAVCLVPQSQSISHQTMSYVAHYLGQDETVFAKMLRPDLWQLRWYTPAGDHIAPGGNSTIALSSILLSSEPDLNQIELAAEGLPGLSSICYRNPTDPSLISVALPSVPPRQIIPESRHRLVEAFGGLPPRCFLVGEQDLIIVFDEESEVRELKPSYDMLFNLDYRAFIATAKGDFGGFVVRTFIVAEGEQRWESSGSARALMNLATYWRGILNAPNDLPVKYLSPRGGQAWCRLDYEHEKGHAVIVTAHCKKCAGPFPAYFEPMEGRSAAIFFDGQ